MEAHFNDGEPRVTAELVALIYRHLPASLLMLATVGALLSGYMLVRHPDIAPVVLVWYGVALAALAGRYWLHERYMATEPIARESESARWLARFRIGALLSALSWGGLAPFIVPGAPLEVSAVVMLVMGGVCAGAVSTLAPVWRLYVQYALCILGPLLICLFAAGEAFQGLFAGLLVLLLLLLNRSARLLRSTLVASLERRFALDAALDAADRALAEAMRANQRLSDEIAERRRAEADLSRARVAAEAANDAKSHFLANMSHEIRTPMNAIIGMSQRALALELDDKARNYVGKVVDAADGLLRIINDILDVSKIEAGKLTLEHHAFQLDAVLDQLVSLLGLRADERGLGLHFDLDPQLPDTLVGDAARLGQVLFNLVGNAVKFTDSGDVVLAARVVEADTHEVELHFSVRDTGIGLSPEQCSQLFESFHQAASAAARRDGGSGLGLVISRRLVEAMQGTIWVDSTPGVGAVFHFSARFGLSAQEPVAARRVSMPPGRVLIADGSPLARETLPKLCSALGLEAEAVDSAEAAIRHIRRASAGAEAYSAVLADWRLPGLAPLLQEVRQRRGERPPGVAAVIMTSGVQQNAEQTLRAGDVGADAALHKPFTASALFAALERIRDHGAVVTPDDGSARARPRMVSLQGLRVLLAEDNEINQELAVALLTSVGVRVEVVCDGEAALRRLQHGVDFDVVLMDCQMPGMDGYATTRQMRADARFAALPVIAMTASVTQSDRDQALAAGMNDFIGKPINLQQMLTIIARWAGRGAAGGASAPDPAGGDARVPLPQR